MMDITTYILDNYQNILALAFGTGGGGFLGWFFSMKSKKLEFHEKAFQINSEMIDAIKSDFMGRIDFLSEMNKELDAIIKEQRPIIKEQREYIKQLHLELKNYKLRKS